MPYISVIYSDPLTLKKWSNSDSPDNLPATQKQNTRQIRRRNSIGDLRDIEKKTPATRKNITDKVIEAPTSPDVLNTIIPVLAEKISETLTPLIEEQVQKCIAAYVEPIKKSINEHEAKINDHTEKICRQFIWINKIDTQLKENSRILDLWDSELEARHKKAKDMDSRLESQEQYSRRTSLRFHNIQVPVDGHGKILHPVNTDDKILSICNSQLGLNLSINDISRSHVIGKAKYGKCQVIVRFMSYRTKDMVYTNKKYLKHNEDGIFITENLTKFRTDLTKKLSQMKYNNQIHASDGRIFVKRAENSRKKLINSFDDISDIERGITASPNQQRSDTGRSPEANKVNNSQQSNNGE
ncbi:unnamed protein product [Mytilus coruscus]|uniref:Uncharacterized protein n=1 Tax=Mytilus coruscus TaxID=42192 RepID=A0A6J8AH31_MYTCO|nr:unnamed protein product [Mytilus coruscus]